MMLPTSTQQLNHSFFAAITITTHIHFLNYIFSGAPGKLKLSNSLTCILKKLAKESPVANRKHAYKGHVGKFLIQFIL